MRGEVSLQFVYVVLRAFVYFPHYPRPLNHPNIEIEDGVNTRPPLTDFIFYYFDNNCLNLRTNSCYLDLPSSHRPGWYPAG